MEGFKYNRTALRIWKIFTSLILEFFASVLLILVLLILLCPIYIIRQLIIIASKIIRPDLVKVLPTRDMFYAVDDIHGRPKSSVVVTLIGKGRMGREVLIQNIAKTLTNTRKSSRELLYPELKSYLVRWFGLIFWKEDPEYDPGNHVFYIYREEFVRNSGKQIFSECQLLREIERHLVQQPYPEGKAHWAIYILNDHKPTENYTDENCGELPEKEHCCVFFKVHHSFMDGFSILNLLTKDIMNCPNLKLSKPSFPKRGWLQEAIALIYAYFRAPFDVLSEAMMVPDQNPWYLPKEKVTNLIHSATSKRIPSEMIKEIAGKSDASFTGVVVNAISGGVRKYMKERGDEISGRFTCLVPFPVPGRPESLGNYLSDCYLEFPIDVADSVMRLRRIEEQLKEIKQSTVSLSSFIMQPVLGVLFYWMISPLVELVLSKSTGVFSSFPCSKRRFIGPSGECVDMYFTAGHDCPGIGIQFLGINYAGGWKLKIQADGGLLPSDAEVERLLAIIVNEFRDMLGRLLITGTVHSEGENV